MLQPVAKTVEEILQGPAFYRIPRFQRPFSWTTEHLDEFWSDAVENFDPGYFIGPMVVYKDGAAYLGIVDGQQRLTTITLILAALRDRLRQLGEDTLADGVHQFIERSDRDKKSRFVLESQVEDETWIQAIQLRNAGQAPRVLPGDLARRAYDFISARLDSLIAIEMGKRPAKTANQRSIKLLKELRDQILGLSVIWVPLDGEDDAYVIFETLNSRGKDLEVADLLKNFFMSHVKAANANVDAYRLRWNTIRDQFAADGAPDLGRFILHWWLSREEYVAERRVFKAVKKKITRSHVPATFDGFEADASRYLKLSDPASQSWTIERIPIRDCLAALQIMRVAQPFPMVLALSRAYDEKVISLKQYVRMLHVVENYHFQVTAISARSSSGGVSEMYASHAASARSCRDGCRATAKPEGS